MITNKIFFKLFFVILFCAIQTNAQEILTPENAVKIALQNNFDIKLSKNNLKIDKTNLAIGNAGMLPKLTAIINDNNSIQNSSQTRQDGTVVELDNAKNISLNYGIGLDWTIFDGLKMFAKYDQLKEIKKLGEANLKLTIITKISEVYTIYYDLVQQQQLLAFLDTTIVISNQRLTLAQNRFIIGKVSKLEVLNAQVDLNTDITLLLKQKEIFANTKILLNQILNRNLKLDYKVIEDIIVNRKLDVNELSTLVEKQNPQLKSQIINKKIKELQLKQIKGNKLPILTLNSGYNFSETQSSLGFTTQASAKGLNYGFSASMNIFDGFSQNRNEKIAKIQIENSIIAIEQQNLALNAQLAISFQSYLTNLQLIDLEQKNQEIAKQNLDITLDKFKIGIITTLEFRTAQLNYINSKVRYNNAQFQTKLSEIDLKELAGSLDF